MNALSTIASNGIPGVNALAPFAAQLLGHASRHIYALGGTLLSATGLAALLPSLTIFSVNVLGFTSAGVAAGSVAAVIQSYCYGAFTSGIFAWLMSFGATAVIAPPLMLVSGVISLGAGAVFWCLKLAGS
ncbi:hypothetical protein BJ912DRAFT_986107 [Pholiota molesta]|nr:hypothetical protein BJ912DRAFT_986107 [Pholiota molesta]